MDPTELKRSLVELEESRRAAEYERLSRKVAKRPLVLYFGRSSGFSDNAKYAFLHAAAAPRPYELLWCGFDAAVHAQLSGLGLPSLLIQQDLRRSIDVLLHAAAAVFCVNPNESLRGNPVLAACLAGARQLQLWHGISVKHLMLDLMGHLDLRQNSLRRGFDLGSRCDAMLSTAASFDAYWHRSFGAGTLLRAGHPRNEVLLREPQPLEMLGAELDPAAADALLGRGGPKLLLVPTWQRGHATWLESPAARARLVAFARSCGATVFAKRHPMVQGDPSGSDGIVELGAQLDLYPWLRGFDLLVTDYSSILFDFLLGGRPVATLDIDAGAHQSYEPDWSLLPPLPEYRHRFVPETLESTLTAALEADHLAPARAESAAVLFESDPLAACGAVQAFVDGWMAAHAPRDYAVIDPFEAAAGGRSALRRSVDEMPGVRGR